MKSRPRERKRRADSAGDRTEPAGDPDVTCRRVIALLDQVPPGSSVIEVLRAHQSALR